MSRRYLVALCATTLAMVLAAFVVMWTAPAQYHLFMPVLALYFGLVSGAQHLLVTRSMNRSPRAFVQWFLGSVTGVLLLHIIVLAVFMFTHPQDAKPFAITFLIGYVVSLVFETIALVLFVKNERQRRKDNQ